MSTTPRTHGQRKRKAPAYLNDAVIDDMSMGITPKRKIRVTCNQTGKSFLAPVAKLSQENGAEITQRDIFNGCNVLYESKSGKTFDVTITEGIRKSTKAIKSPTSKDPAKPEIAARPRKISILDSDSENDRPDYCSGDSEAEGSESGFDTVQVLTKENASLSCGNPQDFNGMKKKPQYHRLALKEMDMDDTSLSTKIKLHDSDRELLITIDRKLDKLLYLAKQGTHSASTAAADVKSESTDYVWNQINLLKVQAKNACAYARALLDILFSKEEQRAGIMFASKKSPKQPLDQERVALLFECIKVKYASDYNHLSIVQTLNQKCRDAKV